MTLPNALLADAVLLLHLAVVAFIVLTLPLIPVGSRRGWRWTSRRGLRLLHLAAIAVVAVQAWLGRYCGLTVLESWLRQQAGQAGYDRSFVAHWVQRLLYHDAPMWAFALLYTAFVLLVLWAWWRHPPSG